MKKNILLVIDTQYDFMMSDGALYVPEAESLIVPLIHYIKNLNSELFHSVYYTMDTHRENTYINSEEAKQFPPHCLMGTSGWENVINFNIISDINIEVIRQYKSMFDMWGEPNTDIFPEYNLSKLTPIQDRDFWWNEVKEQTDKVYVCGVATDVCVKFAVAGLISRGFKVVILKDLTKGIIENIDIFKNISSKEQLTIEENSYNH